MGSGKRIFHLLDSFPLDLQLISSRVEAEGYGLFFMTHDISGYTPVTQLRLIPSVEWQLFIFIYFHLGSIPEAQESQELSLAMARRLPDR